MWVIALTRKWSLSSREQA